MKKLKAKWLKRAVAFALAALMLVPSVPAYASEAPVTEQTSEAVSSEVIADSEVATSEVVSEEVTEAVTEEVTEAVSEEATEAVSEEATEAVSEEVTEEVTEEATEAASEEVQEEVLAIDPAKIDVWDFGAEQLDSSKYNNMLTADVINGFYPGVEAGSTGKNLASFATDEIAFNDGGFPNTHRLRTNNTALTRYDAKNLVSADGTVTYNGYIYSNKSATADVYVSIKANKGDIITIIMGSNGGDSRVVFENMSDATDVQELKHIATAGNSSVASELTFYATQDATYKIYSANEKICLGRIYRERTASVKVSGLVTAPETMTGYSLVFTNTTTGVETVATPDAENKYSVNLNEKFTYKVALKDADTFVISSSQELVLEKGCGDTTFDITAEGVELVTISGKINGLDANSLSYLQLTLTNAEKIYKPIVTITPAEGEVDYAGTYTAQLEKGVSYQFGFADVNDYTINMTAEEKVFTYDADATVDLTFVEQPKYDVAISFEGADAEELEAEADADVTIVLTNLNESRADGSKYVYEFKLADLETLQLRDGAYSVVVNNTGRYVQNLTSNVKVAGEAVEKTIAFTYATSWNFADAAFAIEDNAWRGLKFVNTSKDSKGYATIKEGGSVTIPVDGECVIRINYCYTADCTVGADGAFSTASKSTSKIETYDYAYSGEAGEVVITNLLTGKDKTYLCSIELMEKIEYTDTITVGADKDYATINEALDAVRKMPREAGQVVTIEIDPGNYEEMLVIDVNDIKLVNASATPSIELTNKGVDIDENAVRITSYYGHGYTYFSMGKDCKWDEDILRVNKENGYASFTNPGAGSTSGSYWNATVVIKGSNVSAEGIIFENSFNQYVSAKAAEDVIVAQSSAKEGDVPRAEMLEGDTTVQNKAYVERAAALAILDNMKQVSFDNCKFIGRQDTLYGAKGVTAAFYDCSIYGGTDYIMGGMTAVFAKCDLVFNTSEDKNDVGYITAPQQATGRGYLMYNCTVTSTTPGVDTASEYPSKPGYFGRPWAANTGEAYFYNTIIEASDKVWYKDYGPSLIRPVGWLSTLSGESKLCSEYGTFEYSIYADYIDERASWAGYEFTEVLGDGTPVSVAAFLGTWDAFAGKDMEIVIPDESDRVDNAAAETEKVFSFNVKDATADVAAGTAIEEGTTYAGFFDVVGTVSKKNDTAFEIGKSELGAIAFSLREDGGSVVFGVSSTGSSNNTEFALKNMADGTYVANDKGETVIDVTGVAEVKLTWNDLAAGEYQLVIPATFTKRAGRFYSASVTAVFEETTYSVNFAEEGVTAGQAIAAGTVYDDYFTIVGGATGKTDNSYTMIEIPKSQGGGVQFVVNSYTDLTLALVSTGGSNTSTFGLLDSKGELIPFAKDADGNYVIGTEDDDTGIAIYGNVPVDVTFKGLYGGVYQLVIVDSARGGRIAEMTSVQKACAIDKVRTAWEEIEAPVIKSVALTGENAVVGKVSTVDVTVTGDVSYAGADYVEVTAYDSTGEPALVVTSKKISKESVVQMALPASGDYTFKAVLVRAGEENKESEVTAEAFNFILPLGNPGSLNMKYVAGGIMTVSWPNSVKEATGYKLGVCMSETFDAEAATWVDVAADQTSYDITLADYIEVATATDAAETPEYVSVAVYAVRNEEAGESVSKTRPYKTSVDADWTFVAYGSSTDTKNNGYLGDANDGSVTVYSEGGKGKLVPASTDGLAFYYTTVPATKNFKLTVDVHVDKWTLSNAQEGFGIMAADQVPAKSSSSTLWNNSYMASATKVEYYWNPDTSSIANEGNKITMKLGIGAQEKIGVTADNIELFKKNDTATINNQFKSTMYPLSTSCAKNGAGTYNIIGNYTSKPEGTVEKPITDFTMSIERTDTSYIVTYINEYGREFAKKYYNTEDNLCMIDEENIYVGFFASRNARATFTNIELVTSDHNPDAAPEEQPNNYIGLSNSFISAPVANKADYTLKFNSNWRGSVMITDAAGNVVVPETEVEATNSKGTSYGVSEDVTLAIGKNEYIAYFMPDKEYTQDGGKTLLSDYSKKTTKITVSYAVYGQDGAYLYVSPEGSANGTGEKSNPLDIYTAVKYVRPGQTILIMEGTYNLSKTVKVERGIDGTEDAMIKMIADPEANTRPVFDFGGNCAGMVLAGNYWYFRDFDVTRSQNAQKGIQVSGNNNILDQINTYNNGNTGIQISRLNSTDETIESWPANNLVLNCTSYENADAGYEDADGFAAKLTVGEGNVFDGCVAHHNADDGWDLFAKVETGPIGAVEIRNSIAYKNGYVFDAEGNEINAGNGNGFKLGGEGISGKHMLKNSIAFDNKAKGIDSNSCPDIQVFDSIGYNNLSYNIAFYSKNTSDTAFYAENTISLRAGDVAYDVEDQIDLLGDQNEAEVYNSTNFYWNVAKAKSMNDDGDVMLQRYFKSLTFNGFTRNEDGTLDLGGFLEFRPGVAYEGIGLGDGQASEEGITAEDVIETDGTIDNGNAEAKDENTVDPDDIGGDVVVKDGLWIGKIDTQYYTGKAIKPVIAVYDGTKKLTTKDYAVSYKNNVNAGVATITVKGKGSYAGTATATFEISAISFDEGFVLPTDNIYAPGESAIQISNLSAEYTGKAIAPKPVVYFNGAKLAAKNYTVSAPECKAAGVYTVTVTGKAPNFTDSRDIDFTIVDVATTTHIKKASVSGLKAVAVGEVPAVTLKYKTETLVEGTDYEIVEVRDNWKAGKATMVIEGLGKYAGLVEKKFAVKATGLTTKNTVVTGIEETVVYGGKAVTFPELKVTVNGVELEKDYDYTVTYKNNAKAGTASVVITGIGAYNKTLTKKFKINAFDISADVNPNNDVITSIPDVINAKYVKGGSKIKLNLTFAGRTLVEGKDYTLSYKNITKVATASDKKAPTVVIKGKNGFKGTVTKTFTIEASAFDSISSAAYVTASDVVYANKAGNYLKTKVVAYDGTKKLSKGTDYEKTFKYYKVVDGVETELGAKDIVPAGTEIRVEVIGTKNYSGAMSATYRVVETNISKVSVKTVTLPYNGKSVTLNVVADEETGLHDLSGKILYKGKALEYGVDYEIVPGTYKNNNKAGTAKVTIRGLGDFGGEKVISFKLTKRTFAWDED